MRRAPATCAGDQCDGSRHRRGCGDAARRPPTARRGRRRSRARSSARASASAGSRRTPTARVDTSEVKGVDADLRVRPFLHQGETASMREFLVGAFHAEMGLQAWDPVLCAATDPTAPKAGRQHRGLQVRPDARRFRAAAGLQRHRGPRRRRQAQRDQSGARRLCRVLSAELLQAGPVSRDAASARRDVQLMQRIGCTGCHVQNLTVRNDRRIADVETKYDPERGIFNGLFATATPLFRSVADTAAYPKLQPLGGSFVVEGRVHRLEAARPWPGVPRARLRRQAHHESRHRAAVGRRHHGAVRSRRPQRHARCGDSPPRRRSRERDTRVRRA